MLLISAVKYLIQNSSGRFSFFITYGRLNYTHKIMQLHGGQAYIQANGKMTAKHGLNTPNGAKYRNGNQLL